LETQWAANNDQKIADTCEAGGLADTVVLVHKLYRNTICDSVLSQFVRDLQIFGLREALAYLFELRENVSQRVMEKMVAGYHDVGVRFNSQAAMIKAELERRYRIARETKDISKCVDRLIMIAALDGDGDVWSDGELQNNLSNTSLA
jgi:hypothetical protein